MEIVLHEKDSNHDEDKGGLEGWKVGIICLFSILGGAFFILVVVWIFVWAKKRLYHADYETINV